MKTVSKAIAGLIAGFIISWAMKHNVVIADNLPDFIEELLAALITAVSVYFAPKNKEVK